MGKLTFDYDEEADVLYVSFGVPQEAISYEVGNSLIRVNDDKIVGITIIGFKEHYIKLWENKHD